MKSKRKPTAKRKPKFSVRKYNRCPLCGRPMVRGPSVDEHHLVPKSRGGRAAELVHRVCHRKLHATFTESQLAGDFSTWEALRAHPDIAAFIRDVLRRDTVILFSERDYALHHRFVALLLANLDPSDLALLTRVSVLEDFTPALAAEVEDISPLPDLPPERGTTPYCCAGSL